TMTVRAAITRVTQHERVNFVLTNRLPRRWLTLFVGWGSRLEYPRLCRILLRVWGVFTVLDLSEARETGFNSLQEFFTRERKEGAGPPHRSESRHRRESMRRHRGRDGPGEARLGAAGQGLPLHAHGSARGRGAGEQLSRRLLRDAASRLQHVSPLPRTLRL